MKKFSTFWKVILVIFTISFTAVSTYIGYKIYNYKYGYYMDDANMSDTCDEICYYDGSVKLYNKILGKTTTPRLDWIGNSDGKDTFIVFSKDVKRGFLNKLTGEIVIPAKYLHAWNFSEGLGAVVKNNKVGFINDQGKEVIPLKFSYHSGYDNRIDFLFKDGCCTMTDSLGKHGLIDKTGKWLIEPQYDYIQNSDFGYRKVKLGDKYGLLDKNRQWKFQVEYEDITVLKDGFLLFKDGIQQQVASDGLTVVLPFVYDETQELHYNSGEVTEAGEDILIKSDYIAFCIHKRWGLMDKTGKMVFAAKYDNINALANDLFSCKVVDNWITVDAKGNIKF